MNDNRKILGIYSYVDLLVDSIKELRAKGFEDIRAFSPVPNHEIEDALDSWAFNGQTQDCFNPSEGMLNALWPALVVKDTYDCCCKVASTPGLPSSWTVFEGSAFEEYLNSIDFLHIIVSIAYLNFILPRESKQSA